MERVRLGAERLSDAGHLVRRSDDERDDARPRAAVDAAKLAADELDDPRAAARVAPAPGKLTHGAIDRHAMAASQAIAYSAHLLGARIDRRAERERVDDGELASAFAFIAESRAGEPLPDALRARLGAELGVDLARVRVHTDERAHAAAAQLGARAFTIGDDIFFAAGAFDPSSVAGIELIAHEVAHVAQQRGATRSTERVVSQPGDAHEREAERFAAQFARVDEAPDPARWINDLRRSGGRVTLPMRAELEAELGTSLDFVEAYVGDAARAACQLLSASALAVRNVVAFADPSPQRDVLLHELAHVIQAGGRTVRAPMMFGTATLAVSQPTDDAEVDARAVAQGAQVSATASPDVIHRSGPNDPTTTPSTPWTLDDAKKAFTTTFLPTVKKRGATDRYQFAAAGGASGKDFLLLFDKTSLGMFQTSEYQSAIHHTTPEQKAKSREDLQKLHTGSWSELGLVQPSHDAAKSWAWVDPTEHPTQQVEYLLLKERTAPDPKAMWTTYCDVVKKLHGKGSIAGFTEVTLGTKKYPVDDRLRTAYTDAEYKALEDQLSKAIIAEPKYKCHPKTYWETFYKEVCEAAPLLPQGVQGNVFKEIVKAELGGFAESELLFDSNELTSESKRRYADGYNIAGKTLLETKSGTYPKDKFLAQANDYAKIVRANNPIPGYLPPDAKGKTFTKVIYVFPTVALAKDHAGMLNAAFAGIEDRLEIRPPVDGIGDATVVANPTFLIPLKQKNTTTHTIAQPFLHPGIRAERAVLRTDAPGSTKVVSGTVDLTVDAAGGITGDKQTKPITGADGQGRLENKLPKLKVPGLDKILPRLSTEAKLTDDGVEATITVSQGPSGVPGLTLEAGTLTARYGSAGLAVEGTIGVAHTSGKVSGRVSVGYAANQWRFEGTATVSAGIVPGLSAFTAKVKYDAGKWSFGVDQVSYERKVGAVNLKGTAYGVEYDVSKGDFGAMLIVDADFGMFGTARAQGTIEHNKLKELSLSYDSPELKYPAKAANPTLKGTVGGTITYANEQFSGALRGTAQLNVPALKKIAGDAGLGLAVDAHVNADGTYSGTIATTTPLKFGKYFEVPSLSCTINPDGSVAGEFAIKIKNIKHLESAQIGCKIDKDGFKVTSADVHASFGQPTDKMWGTLDVGYTEAAGLSLGGTLNVKIKEGMVAKGTVTYNAEKNAIDVALTVDEITLLDFKKTQNLFKFAKQIPLVSFYNIVGIYLDLGLDLDFEFDMKLGLKPTITLDGLSFETWEYQKVSAQIELLGQLRAALIATPKVGLGLFAISPSLLRGGGGLKVPITGEALLKPTGKLGVSYTPSGGVEGEATIGMQLTFGIKGAVKPYAEAAVLDGAWNPNWTGDALSNFEILPPKELFSFTLDLAGDMKKKEPQLPTSPQAPTPPTASRQIAQQAPQATERGDSGPGREATPPATMPAGGGAADDSMFKMASLTGALKGLPGYATITGFMEKAAKVWDKIKGFFGRVAKAFKSFFEALGDAVGEILDGFAKEGLGYLPKLIKKIVGPTVWDVIEPIVNAAAGTGEQILQLFETDPPASVEQFFPWALKLMQKAFGIAFDSLPALINALREMMTRLVGLAPKIVTHMVNQGMIGVRRHQYYYWLFGDNYFLAADEYKINVLGTNIYFRESGVLLNPNDLAAAGLFTVLEQLGVPATNNARDDKTGDTYRDRWV